MAKKQKEKPMVTINDKEFNIEDMTDEFDLIVIDYPHVGEVAAKGLLAQLDTPSYKKQLEKLRNEIASSNLNKKNPSILKIKKKNFKVI
mgnify:CR=1 FL=1